MFNLEQSIAEWRRQMLAAGIKTPVPLEELEAHFREEIERQTRAGSSAQIAFEIAARQIGQGKRLKIEFAKGKSLRDILEIELIRKDWEAKWGPPVLMLLSNFMFLFFGAMLLFKPGNFSALTFAEQMSALAAVVVSYLLFSSGFWGADFFLSSPTSGPD